MIALYMGYGHYCLKSQNFIILYAFFVFLIDINKENMLQS